MSVQFIVNVIKKEFLSTIREKSVIFSILFYLFSIYYFFPKFKFLDVSFLSLIFSILSFLISIFLLSTKVFYFEKSSGILEISLSTPLKFGELIFGKTIFIFLFAFALSLITNVFLFAFKNFSLLTNLMLMLKIYALSTLFFFPFIFIVGVIQLRYGNFMAMISNLFVFFMIFKLKFFLKYFYLHTLYLIAVLILLNFLAIFFVKKISTEKVVI